MGKILIIRNSTYTPPEGSGTTIPVNTLLGYNLPNLQADPEYTSKMITGTTGGNHYVIISGTPTNIRVTRVGVAWGVDHTGGSIGFSFVKKGEATPSQPQYTITAGADKALGEMVYIDVAPIDLNIEEDGICMHNSNASDWRVGMYGSAKGLPSATWKGFRLGRGNTACQSSFDQGRLSLYNSYMVIDLIGRQI